MERPKTRAVELKLALANARPSNKGGYPKELRAQALRYVEQRDKNQATTRAIAAELGVKETTIVYWRNTLIAKGKTEPQRTFKRVRVVEAPLRAPSRAFVVHTRHGVRIEGLSLDDIVTLLSKLP